MELKGNIVGSRREYSVNYFGVWLNMSGIVYDARRIKAYEGIQKLGAYAGESEDFVNKLWEELVLDNELLMEFMYYLDHHTLLDKAEFKGYTLTDLYFWQMNRYNLIRDMGKNFSSCNKEGMVLNAFRTMLDLKKDPEKLLKRLSEDKGMDQL